MFKVDVLSVLGKKGNREKDGLRPLIKELRSKVDVTYQNLKTLKD